MTVVLRASKPERHRPAESLDVHRERARYLAMLRQKTLEEKDTAMESVFNQGHRYLAEEDNPEFNINTFVSVL